MFTDECIDDYSPLLFQNLAMDSLRAHSFFQIFDCSSLTLFISHLTNYCYSILHKKVPPAHVNTADKSDFKTLCLVV